jgi:hypothetical protein
MQSNSEGVGLSLHIFVHLTRLVQRGEQLVELVEMVSASFHLIVPEKSDGVVEMDQIVLAQLQCLIIG